MGPAPRYLTIWISDVHLGLRASKADELVAFLHENEADRYYLVGDIFDGWALQRSWYWPPSHNAVIETLLEKVRQGADMIYIPGNHDEAARQFPGIRLGGIMVQSKATHTTADGRRFLVVHGDEFDGIIRHARWISVLGALAYVGILKLNNWYNQVRRWMGRPYWSLAAYLKYKTKRAVQFIADFEEAVAAKARAEQADGVVCGHIHHPELRDIDGICYANCGDWVESCTALVEHHDGHLEIVRWLPAQPQMDRSAVVEAASGDGQVLPVDRISEPVPSGAA